MINDQQITQKDLSFINDLDLRVTLLERLNELDRVFLVNGNLSTVFLSISTVEGIFKHLANIFKTKIQALPNYPPDPVKGGPKDFGKLTIDDLYLLLKDLNILPDVNNFDQVYKLFRDYRNFIHPQAQVKKDWPAGLGQAQMALGLLNATVDHLSRFIFINQFLFEKVAGKPDYDSLRILDLPQTLAPMHSFITLRDPIIEKLSMAFDAELSPDSILNFVFNFKDDSNFKMIRLDKRGQPFLNSLLHCKQKYSWYETGFADQPAPPQNAIFHVGIEIDKSTRKFEFSVNGKAYAFNDKTQAPIILFNEFDPGLRIGLFNELRAVKISNFKISI